MHTIADEAKRDAKLAALAVLASLYVAWKVSPAFGGALAVVFALQTVLLWKAMRAGVVLALAVLLCVLAWFAWLLITKGFLWTRVIVPLGLLLGLRAYWYSYGDLLRGKANWDDPQDKDSRRATKEAQELESEGEEDDKPLTAIVLLRTKPKFLDDKVLLEIVKDAWDPARKLDEEELFAVGESPIFIVKSPQALWTIHNHAGPYFDDEKAAERIPDLRLRKAVSEHRAWLSVDLTSPFDSTLTPDLFYPYIFRLIRELADEDTLVIFRPETGEINIWSKEVADNLGSSDPLENFAVPVHSPVISVSDQDPRMKEAVEEARRNFGEFRLRWAERKEDAAFIVKASIQRGSRNEVIWLEVTGLEPDFIHGTLANEPVNLEGLKAGDTVEVPIADLYDWAIAGTGMEAPLGLYTEKVVREAEREARAAMQRESEAPAQEG